MNKSWEDVWRDDYKIRVHDNDDHIAVMINTPNDGFSRINLRRSDWEEIVNSIET